MDTAHDIIIRKLTEPSRIDPADEEALRLLPVRTRDLAPDEDLALEDDDSGTLALVLDGLLARYRTRSNGKRQYLSFHMAGDVPDAQALFLEKRDHAICAIG